MTATATSHAASIVSLYSSPYSGFPSLNITPFLPCPSWGAKGPHLWMRTQHHLFSELWSALGLCIIRCPPPKEASLTDVGGAPVCEAADALLQLSLCVR